MNLTHFGWIFEISMMWADRAQFCEISFEKCARRTMRSHLRCRGPRPHSQKSSRGVVTGAARQHHACPTVQWVPLAHLNPHMTWGGGIVNIQRDMHVFPLLVKISQNCHVGEVLRMHCTCHGDTHHGYTLTTPNMKTAKLFVVCM